MLKVTVGLSQQEDDCALTKSRVLRPWVPQLALAQQMPEHCSDALGILLLAQEAAQASTLHRVQRVSRGDPCPQPLWDQINHVPQNCKNHFWKGWTREPLQSRSFLPKIHVFVDLAFVWDQVLDFSPFISQVLGIYHQDDLLWQRYGKARFSFQTWVKMWINRNSIPCTWWFFTSSELSNLLLEMQVFSVHFPSKNLFSWLPDTDLLRLCLSIRDVSLHVSFSPDLQTQPLLKAQILAPHPGLFCIKYCFMGKKFDIQHKLFCK